MHWHSDRFMSCQFTKECGSSNLCVNTVRYVPAVTIVLVFVAPESATIHRTSSSAQQIKLRFAW